MGFMKLSQGSFQDMPEMLNIKKKKKYTKMQNLQPTPELPEVGGKAPTISPRDAGCRRAAGDGKPLAKSLPFAPWP